MYDYRQLFAGAVSGDAEMQCKLGDFLTKGKHGVPVDYAAACDWYELAWKQFHPQAAFRLGWCYYKGTGRKTDRQTAAKLFMAAANHGHSLAQSTLAGFYARGIPKVLGKDLKRAYAWYDVAIETGVPGTQNISDHMHLAQLLEYEAGALEEAKALAVKFRAQQIAPAPTTSSDAVKAEALELFKRFVAKRK